MPWSTHVDHPECPAESPWGVVADETGEVVGCHITEDEANAQVAALYANVEEADDPVLAAVYEAWQANKANPAGFAALPAPEPVPFDPARFTKGYWRGVLAVEGVPTGDAPRREFAPDSLTWRTPPLSIYWQRVTAEGHDNAMIVARADDVWRSDVELEDGTVVPGVRGRGQFDLVSPDGADAYRLIGEKFMRGISVTVSETQDVDVEYVFPDGGDAEPLTAPEKVIFHRAEAIDACLTGQPALKQAFVEPVADDDWTTQSAPWVPAEQDADEAVPAAEPDDAVGFTASPAAGLALAEATAAPTGVVVVARPADPAGLAVDRGLPADELHVTLGYYGDVAALDPTVLSALGEWSAGEVGFAADAKVSGVARMGSDDPQAVALLVEAPELADLRSRLEAVAAPDGTHPHFTPHITLGYGVEFPAEVPASVALAGVELWAGGERFSGGEAIVAALRPPVKPPIEWTRNPKLSGPTPATYLDSGRCFGHLAAWGVCHLSFAPRMCVTPPKGGDYSGFTTGVLVCEGGEEVPVGQLTLGTLHAAASLGFSPALHHYEHTGHGVADVAIGEDRFGIWFAGALRPDVTESQLRVLRASGISGDWRRTPRGKWRLAGALAVNVPGFPIPRTATFTRNGEQTALVAAGVLVEAPTNVIPLSVADRIARSVGLDHPSRRAAAYARVFGKQED